MFQFAIKRLTQNVHKKLSAIIIPFNIINIHHKTKLRSIMKSLLWS